MVFAHVLGVLTFQFTKSQFSDKNWTKRENRKIFEILSFLMSIPDSFCLKNCIYLISKDCGPHILSLSALFNVPVDEVCQKFGTKLHNIFENFKIFGRFVIFTEKTSINSSEKATGQRILSLLTLFSVSIHKVRQNFGKICKKPLKFGEFWDFCHFRCQFSFRTLQLSLRKSLLDNKLVPCWRFSTFYSTKSIKNSTKTAIKLSKLEIFAIFLIFWGHFWDHPGVLGVN